MTHATPRILRLAAAAAAALVLACQPRPPAPPPATHMGPVSPYEGTLTPLLFPGERHITNVRQLTFGGENAEAYWSADGRRLVFQSTAPPHECDQIYVLDVDEPDARPRLVSSGKGRTTCAYLTPDGRRVLYSSTQLSSPECPRPPDRSHGYAWGLFDYDLFVSGLDGRGLTRLTDTPGYDAEATVSVDGRKVVFTSVRDGDLELYSMDLDGRNVRRLTNAPGYDGGAFFSDDGEWIVYRTDRSDDPARIADFKALLAKALVRPSALEIHVMRADGSGDRQVTANGAANFAPFFFRGGHEKIVFCSNLADPKRRNFDIWTVNVDGTDLERVTYNPTFDGFPMFSPDGRRLAFCSNRHNAKPGETNVFVADWVGP